METEIHSISELESYASRFLSTLLPKEDGATVIGLCGDLGSGKTAFTKAMGKAIGIQTEILSPTFVLAKFYDIVKHSSFSKLIHIDLYRIDDPSEILALRFPAMLTNKRNLVVIEWPERGGKHFPPDAVVLTFRFIDESTRAVQVNSPAQ